MMTSPWPPRLIKSRMRPVPAISLVREIPATAACFDGNLRHRDLPRMSRPVHEEGLTRKPPSGASMGSKCPAMTNPSVRAAFTYSILRLIGQKGWSLPLPSGQAPSAHTVRRAGGYRGHMQEIFD